MPAKPKVDPRKMMQKAVAMMRRSVAEPRKDGKRSPAVGAVLIKPNGSVETACRGELRDGDHAEFALLERKNRSNALDGCVLFTTLEPCAKGARTPPKLSCAERIVLARIKQVWIGIEDPDPKVDRKGIKYLQEHGVAVEMFDLDLQEEITAFNKEYIAQAEERAAAADEEEFPVVLSELENPAAASGLKDFSNEALEQYRASARIAEPVDSDSFRRRLLHLGLIKEEGNRFVPTGFGLLLFGRSPRDVMQQAGVLATIHYPNGRDETHDFDGPLVQVPDAIEVWLKNKLPNTIDRNQMQRREAPELPFESIREAVVNALVHRDYDIKGAKIQLVVNADTIVVKSPGRPVEPITLEQIQAFNAPMLSRNPTLHYVFARMRLAEERGLGLKSLKSRASELGLPLPKFSWEDPYLTLSLYRNAASAERILGALFGELSKSERVGWQWLVTQDTVTSTAYAETMGVPIRTALNHLRQFTKLGLLRKTGSGRATQYHVVGR
jgi:ATP-dependent DNA helicase RecG